MMRQVAIAISCLAITTKWYVLQAAVAIKGKSDHFKKPTGAAKIS